MLQRQESVCGVAHRRQRKKNGGWRGSSVFKLTAAASQSDNTPAQASTTMEAASLLRYSSDFSKNTQYKLLEVEEGEGRREGLPVRS